jgi:hypothetical protein
MLVRARGDNGFGKAARRSEATQDLCRRCSRALSATGRDTLAGHDSCGRRNRGIAVACIAGAAMVEWCSFCLSRREFQRLRVAKPCTCHCRIRKTIPLCNFLAAKYHHVITTALIKVCVKRSLSLLDIILKDFAQPTTPKTYTTLAMHHR